MNESQALNQIEHENFAIQLTSQCKSHDEWLAVVRFGLKTLLENQPLLIEIIVREAENDWHRRSDSRTLSDAARQIFTELGLRFTAGREG